MSLKWMEKKGKRALGALTRAVLPSNPISPAESDWSAVKRVLLVRQDRRVGDLVMNTPLFRGTRERFPEAHIALLLRGGYEELFADDPAIDEFLPFRPGQDLYNPIGLAMMAQRLKHGRFDLAIDCSNFKSFSLTNGILTMMSGAPLRIGFIDKESPAFLNVLVPAGEQRHYAANQVELLAPTGVADLSPETRLYFSEERAERGREKLRGLAGGGGPVALVFTGAANLTKQWGVHRYLEAAEKMRAAGLSVVFATGPGDRSLAGNIGGFPSTPTMSLGDFAAVVNACDVFVSGDTGPMHVAVACGVPTVTIFLEDHSARYGYHDGKRHLSIRSPEETEAATVAQAAVAAIKGGGA
jgi:heptosyltransferase-2/heptosyltransferase-3